MAAVSKPKIRPPFAWLGRFTTAAGLAGVVAVSMFFRFYQLNILPPGLDTKSAAIALQASNFLNHGAWPELNVANGYASIWVILQAASIKLFGHTELALRLWPAILGSLAVVLTWLWARQWFGVRIAWLASLLMAASPWAVTASRNGTEAAILPFIVSLTLLLATRVWQKAGAWNYVALAAALTLDLLSGPAGWLLALGVIITGLTQLARSRKLFIINRARSIGLAAFVIGVALAGMLAASSTGILKHLPQAAGIVNEPAAFGSNLVKSLLMFNVRGDESYLHNLAAEPLLNAFTGLMLIAGILVGISRLHFRRYRILFAFLLVLLLPAILTITGAPNASRALPALPLIFIFVAAGISYMLELWYATFPINSAARTTGQAAILVLLALSIFQGYTQYFRAWAGSGEVYLAYNEGPAQLARNIGKNNFNGQTYVVAQADEQPVISFLAPAGNYQLITAPDITSLPVASVARQFYITTTSREETVKALKVKFPGGVLRPHISSFNMMENYYIYEVGK